MSTVFLVSELEVDEFSPLAVFTTREAADTYCGFAKDVLVVTPIPLDLPMPAPGSRPHEIREQLKGPGKGQVVAVPMRGAPRPDEPPRGPGNSYWTCWATDADHAVRQYNARLLEEMMKNRSK